MDPAAVLRRLRLPVAGRAVRLSGGDVSEVWRVGDLVVKCHPHAPPGFFAAEARGLSTLGSAGCRVPTVHAVADDAIVLAWLGEGPAAWDDLAEQLARLHTQRVSHYGLDTDAYLAAFPLPAGTASGWGEVFWGMRVLPLVRATEATLGPSLTQAIAALPSAVTLPEEGAVLVHGDLWSGNVHMGAHGAALIDPSAQWGERALDLGMMTLFGGFPTRFWRAYEAAVPIPAEVRRALPATQLYFLLVHVYLFGAGYVPGVAEAVRRLR